VDRQAVSDCCKRVIGDNAAYVWMGSWLAGSDSIQIQVVSERLREGRFRGQEELAGRNCYVVEWEQGWKNSRSEWISNRWLYYVDADSFVLRRMDAYYSTTRDGTVIDEETRQFVYTVMEVSDQPSNVDWDIWPLVCDHVPPKTAESICEMPEV